MQATSQCPNCGASISPNSSQCKFCGTWLEKQAEKCLKAWTQGIAEGGYSDGNYDTVEYPAMPLSQALRMVENLPRPPYVDDPGAYCPPALGFGERNISRMEDGRYFLWPEDRPCSSEEAREWVLEIFGQH